MWNRCICAHTCVYGHTDVEGLALRCARTQTNTHTHTHTDTHTHTRTHSHIQALCRVGATQLGVALNQLGLAWDCVGLLSVQGLAVIVSFWGVLRGTARPHCPCVTLSATARLR